MQSFNKESLQEKLVRRKAYLSQKYHGAPDSSNDERPQPAPPAPQQVDQIIRYDFVRPRQAIPLRSPTREERVNEYLNRLENLRIPNRQLPNQQQNPVQVPVSQEEERIRQELDMELQRFSSTSRNQ